MTSHLPRAAFDEPSMVGHAGIRPTASIRQYLDVDEPSWVRCRALSFLGSQYYDDVKPQRTRFERPALCLVAVLDQEVVGILDVEIDGASATIDTIATHPDHGQQGIASALLTSALPMLKDRGITTLDAWTREDVAANAWYQRHGFAEEFRYLHVYKDWDGAAEGFTSPPGLSSPVRVFAHAQIEHESDLRARFRRIYVCRQYKRSV